METIGLHFQRSNLIWMKNLCLISHELVGIRLDFIRVDDIEC